MLLHTKQIIVTAGILFALASAAGAQTRPSIQAEVEQILKENRPMESSPCRIVLEVAKGRQDIRQGLGWWGRGFIEGFIYGTDTNGELEKKASEFGISVHVVTAHIEAYCTDNPTKTPFDAVQDLLLKVLK